MNAKKIIALTICCICLCSVINPVHSTNNDPSPYIVKYYTNEEMTDEITDLSTVDTSKAVYYNIICSEGYVCRSASVVASYADNEKIIFGNLPVSEIIAECGILGDVDKNGTVNLSDVSMLLKHIAGYSFGGKYDGTVSDYDGDGKITLSDCSKMLKVIANWNDVSPAYGRSEDFKMRCIVDIDTTVIIQDNACEKMTGNVCITVLDSTDSIKEYINNTPASYDMSNKEGIYSEDYLQSTYGEEFFSSHDLIIVDADAPIFMNGLNDHVEMELSDTDTVQIVFYNVYGAMGTKTSVAHCLMAVPKAVNIGSKDILVVERFTVSPAFDSYLNWQERVIYPAKGVN